MTREDAEEFLREVDGELTWESDEHCPPPPQDRIELALCFLEQIAPIPISPHAPFDIAKLNLNSILFDQPGADSDMLTDRAWREAGKLTNIGELFLLLERIYKARWRRGWLSGASPEADQTVQREMLDALRAVTGRPDFTFLLSERLSDRLSPVQGRDLCWELEWVGYEGRELLVHVGKSSLTEALEMVLLFVGLALVLLALLGSLNGWLAVLGFIGLVGVVIVSSRRTWHVAWKEPNVTFGALAEALQRRARDEYDAMVEAAQDENQP